MDASATPARNEKRFRPTLKSFATVSAVAFGLSCLSVSCSNTTETEAAPQATPTTPAPNTSTTSTTASTPSTPASTPSSSTVDAPTTTNAPATTPPPAATTSANVYWRSTVPHPHGSPDRITAGTRNVNTSTPIRSSLEALFAGTNVAEQVTGMATSVPAGTQVLGISRSGTTATINLTAEFANPASPLDATTRLAQVVFTVTQFDGIDQVQFHIDGTPVDPIFSLAVDQGLTRNSFNDDVRAYIMVEQPAPEAQTTNPLVISGEANTFEATVRYAVTNDNGDLLIEGFTTAAIYNFGTWGAFEVTIDAADFPAGYQHGPGKITLWEDNSGDEGPDRINVVEVPVILPER